MLFSSQHFPCTTFGAGKTRLKTVHAFSRSTFYTYNFFGRKLYTFFSALKLSCTTFEAQDDVVRNGRAFLHRCLGITPKGEKRLPARGLHRHKTKKPLKISLKQVVKCFPERDPAGIARPHIHAHIPSRTPADRRAEIPTLISFRFEPPSPFVRNSRGFHYKTKKLLKISLSSLLMLS